MEDAAELAMTGSLAARKKCCGAKEGYLEAPDPERKQCNFWWGIFDRWLMWLEIIIAGLIVILSCIILPPIRNAEPEQMCCGLFKGELSSELILYNNECEYNVLAEDDGILTTFDFTYNITGKTYRFCTINDIPCVYSSGTIFGTVSINQCINTLGLNLEYSDLSNNFYYPDICTIPWLEEEFSGEGDVVLLYGLITILMDSFAILMSVSMCQAQLGVKCFEDGLCAARKLKRGRNIFAYYIWCCCCCCKGENKERGIKWGGKWCVTFTWLSSLVFASITGQAINGYLSAKATSSNINISECGDGDDYILYDVTHIADGLAPWAAILEAVSLIGFILVIVAFIAAMCPIMKCWKEVPEEQAKEWEELVTKEALEQNETYGCCGWKGLCPCCFNNDNDKVKQTKAQMTTVVTKSAKEEKDGKTESTEENTKEEEAGNADEYTKEEKDGNTEENTSTIATE